MPRTKRPQPGSVRDSASADTKAATQPAKTTTKEVT